jgi:hypothetical protein
MKKQYIWILLSILCFSACKKLDQEPESTATRNAVFSTESGLKLYTNSFYPGTLPARMRCLIIWR